MAPDFEADVVADGELALALMNVNWPDVMLLDLTLADMTAEEVYRRMTRSFGRAPPTIVISAARDGARRAKAIPGACYLAKPYTVEQLCEVIHPAARGASSAS